MLTNQLARSPSLYLKQHADQPVHWQIWSDETWAHAKQLDRPVLLSIGYSACHWCHVMAHETFDNPQIAQFLNAHFLCIKIDREEHPAVDFIYQRAIMLMEQQGGWPLTMFATPQGEPFWGGTYFPPDDRYGRPGFHRIIHALHQTWQDKRRDYEQTGDAIAQGMKYLDTLPTDGKFLTQAELVAWAEKLFYHCDFNDGGIGNAPKFPQTQPFEFLHRHADNLRPHDPMHVSILQWLEKTLDNICLGGLFDHLGGGFARYATDNFWLVPHFEKMLYDNALLLSLLCRVMPEKPLYRHCIAETIEWLKREMTDTGGGFYAALDADSEGEEGKFYLWDEAEIRAVLDNDRCDEFLRCYNVTPTGHLDGKNILNRLGEKTSSEDSRDIHQDFSAERAKLFAHRARRPHPGTDRKILADWNGLMIAALAQCAGVYDNSDWQSLAVRAFDFVSETMRTPSDSLYHCHADGKSYIDAGLDDYAHMAMAALTLYNLIGDETYLQKAAAWVAHTQKTLKTPSGAYRMHHDNTSAAISAPVSSIDNPVPSGNAVTAKTLFRLALMTGDSGYADDARRIIAAFADRLAGEFAMSCGLLNAVLSEESLICFALGGDTKTQTEARRLICRHACLDFVIISHEKLQAKAQFYGYDRENAANDDFYVIICQNQRCLPPLTDISQLQTFLKNSKNLLIGS